MSEELTAEELHAIAVHNANVIYRCIVMGSVGLPAEDVINGAMLAIQNITEALPVDGIKEHVANALHALANHLTGDCGCGQHGTPPGTPPAAPTGRSNLH